MDIDYRIGLKKLAILAKGTSWYLDFLTHEDALSLSLLEYERHHDERQKSEISRIVRQLNRLSVENLKISFNELCKEENLEPINPPPPISEVLPSSSAQQDVHLSFESAESPSAQPGPMRRWAVLIGVNEYEDNKTYGNLKYCADDVKKIRNVLLTGGFEEETIRVLSDQEARKPKREYILPTLEQVANLTGPDDLLLFYFGGHGLAQNGESYLIPSNAIGTSLRDVAIQVRRVKEIIENARAKLKVLIFDACHSGERIGARDAELMSKEFIESIGKDAEGLAILSSCKQGERSYDWEEKKCGVFTYFLLEALSGKADLTNKRSVTVSDVNTYVCHNVKNWASSFLSFATQNPTMYYFVSGEIHIVDYRQKPSQAYDSIAEATFLGGDVEEKVDRERKASLQEMLDRMEQSARYLQKVTNDIRKLCADVNNIWAEKIHELAAQFRETMAINLPSVEREYPIDQQFKKLITMEMPYLYEEFRKLIDRVENLCTIKNSRKIEERMAEILQKLATLQVKLVEFQDKLVTIRQENDIGPPQEDNIGLPISSIERYVGDIKALREGNVHSIMKDKLQSSGISANDEEKSVEEDILERFLDVPLHALFLYTTQDSNIESYIINNWNALESLSGNNCDIYFSIAQTKDRENAYKQIHELDVIKQAKFADITQLPGLFFWDKSGATSYISFGFDPSAREITRILRIVFYEIEKDASIVSVLRAQQMLKPSD